MEVPDGLPWPKHVVKSYIKQFPKLFCDFAIFRPHSHFGFHHFRGWKMKESGSYEGRGLPVPTACVYCKLYLHKEIGLRLKYGAENY
jgi:hypothetical protein